MGRDFSVNRQIEVEHIGEKSYVVHPFRCDAVRALGGVILQSVNAEPVLLVSELLQKTRGSNDLVVQDANINKPGGSVYKQLRYGAMTSSGNPDIFLNV